MEGWVGEMYARQPSSKSGNSGSMTVLLVFVYVLRVEVNEACCWQHVAIMARVCPALNCPPARDLTITSVLL